MSGQVSLLGTLKKAEANADEKGDVDVRLAFKIAREECQFPELGVVWTDALEEDVNGVLLCEDDDCVDPQAVGHALVQASFAGLVHCARKFSAIQALQYVGNFLTGRFRAYASLKAAEAGHVDVVVELLKPIGSASSALLGYGLATKYKPGHYPFVTESLTGMSVEWMKRLGTATQLLPRAEPTFQASGVWELQGPKGASAAVHEATCGIYQTFFLWRLALVAATNGRAEVFQVLVRELGKNGEMAGPPHPKSDEKKIWAMKSKLESLMYHLIEELCILQIEDGVLYALWYQSLPCASSNAPGLDLVRPHPKAAGTNSVARAQNGLWELQADIPVMMMPMEVSFPEEDTMKRMKVLTEIFPQRAQIGIQLVADVAMLLNCIQVTVTIKHVRMKVDNSLWEETRIGHFPCSITLAVTPHTTEGAGCTMSNSSSNVGFKVGVGERIQGSANVTGFAGPMGGGARLGLGVSAGKSVSTTIKSQPWRFEQLPVNEKKGGSYVWNLQSMKGQEFSRFNPLRMAEVSSAWRFGRRVPANPLAELPFTSEGGINFTGAVYDDTIMWRFPKSMNESRLKWTIQGEFRSTYTSSRYWETRVAKFSSDIVETLKALEVDKKDKDKGGDGDKKDKEKKKDKKKERGDDDEDEEIIKEKKKKDKVEDDELDEKSEKKKKRDKEIDTKATEDENEVDDVSVSKKKKKEIVDEDDDNVHVKKKEKKTVEEEDDDVPVRKKDKVKVQEDDDNVQVKKKKKVLVEDDAEDVLPVKKGKKVTNKDGEDDDLTVKPVNKVVKKVVDEDDDDEAPLKVKKGKQVSADDEEDVPVVKTKKKEKKNVDDDEYNSPLKKENEKKVEIDDEEDDEPSGKKMEKKVVDEEEVDAPGKKQPIKISQVEVVAKDEVPVTQMKELKVNDYQGMEEPVWKSKPKAGLRPPPGRR